MSWHHPRWICPALLLATSCAGPPAHMVLRGGPVYANADSDPYEAIAIRDGKITALGSYDRSESWIGGSTEVVELDGRAVYPGFTDGHAHLMGIGNAAMQLDLVGTASYAEVVERARAFAADLPEGAWLIGRGWDQNDWEVQDFPHHGALSEALPDRPVMLVRVDGHALLANAAAMQAARVDSSTDDPDGGRVLRDAAGEPSGVFIDAAKGLVSQAAPERTHSRRIAAAERGIDELHRAGITAIHDAGASRADIAAFEFLVRQGEFPIRAHVMVSAANREEFDWWMQRGPQFDYWDAGRLTVRAAKIYADGALGSRGAALLDDYSDEHGNRGLVLTPYEELVALAAACKEAGFQACTHAIGDRANRMTLDAYEEVLGKDARRSHRWRIEHAQVLQIDDIPRFEALGVLPAMQPQHQVSDMPWAEDRLGSDRVTGAYAWRALLDNGSIIPGGSDAPVERLDPIGAFIASVWRTDRAGVPPGGWYPGQAMTRAEAFASLTEWAAFAAFEERHQGKLESGRRADLTILSHDLMTASREELSSARVELTIFDGEVVYRAE